MDSDTLSLIRRIEEAFPDPGFESTGQDRCHCDECNDLADFFEGKHWMDVTPEEVFQAHAGISLLSDEAFNYFLPAYLTCSLRDRPTVDVVFENLGSTFLDSRFRTPQGLTPQQRGALYEWLEFYVRFEQSELETSRNIVPQDERHRKALVSIQKKEEKRVQRLVDSLSALKSTYAEG